MPKVRKLIKSRQIRSKKPVLKLKKPIVLRKKAPRVRKINYQNLVEHMNEAMWVGDRNEITVYANPKFSENLFHTSI